MNRTAYVLVALLAAVLLAVAACGGDDSSTTSPSAVTFAPVGSIDTNSGPTARPTRTARVEPGTEPQPCSLIAPATIDALIGTITDVQPRTGECEYTGALGTLTVHVESAANVDEASQKLTQIAGAGAEAAGVGDGGFYVSDTEIAGRKGVHVFTITTTRANAKGPLLTLAEEAVTNLPVTQ